MPVGIGNAHQGDSKQGHRGNPFLAVPPIINGRRQRTDRQDEEQRQRVAQFVDHLQPGGAQIDDTQERQAHGHDRQERAVQDTQETGKVRGFSEFIEEEGRLVGVGALFHANSLAALEAHLGRRSSIDGVGLDGIRGSCYRIIGGKERRNPEQFLVERSIGLTLLIRCSRPACASSRKSKRECQGQWQ